jgi:hypothetical protein
VVDDHEKMIKLRNLKSGLYIASQITYVLLVYLVCCQTIHSFMKKHTWCENFDQQSCGFRCIEKGDHPKEKNIRNNFD